MTRGAKALRVRRTAAVASDAFDADAAEYADGVELEVPADDTRPAEQWARLGLEQTPTALRWFIVAGWRLVLGLRLGPRHSTEHVLGWKIIRDRDEEVVLESRSAFLTAHLVFRRDGTRLTWSTFVHYDQRIAAVIWLPVSLLHRRIVPYALGNAASRANRSATAGA